MRLSTAQQLFSRLAISGRISRLNRSVSLPNQLVDLPLGYIQLQLQMTDCMSQQLRQLNLWLTNWRRCQFCEYQWAAASTAFRFSNGTLQLLITAWSICRPTRIILCGCTFYLRYKHSSSYSSKWIQLQLQTDINESLLTRYNLFFFYLRRTQVKYLAESVLLENWVVFLLRIINSLLYLLV